MRAENLSRDVDLAFDRSLFRPGQRVCVAVSGGADSVALLRVLAKASAEMGVVLSAVHIHHGIRGVESDVDAAFVRELAARMSLPVQIVHVDAPTHAATEKISLETAARNLRYKIFRQILGEGQADLLTTAHTLDDQAETVVMKLLRGAWTEGLSGIHPVHKEDAGKIVRPLLSTPRVEIERYLNALSQLWREDASNRDRAHTRNRVRHDLLPTLRDYNPKISEQLARMATLARDEEAYWSAELARILPALLLPGKPVRGGGRSVATNPDAQSLGIDVQRLLAYPIAVQRRVLRAAAEQIQSTAASEPASLNFDETDAVLALLSAPASTKTRRLQLSRGLEAERTPRELRMQRIAPAAAPDSNADMLEYSLPVPGSVEATAFGLIFSAESSSPHPVTLLAATVRAWRAGDRVHLTHTRGPKKVSEVLDRLHVHGKERQRWPVVAWEGEIVWMQGATLALPQNAIPKMTIAAQPVPFETRA